jgi:hypothetical protein
VRDKGDHPGAPKAETYIQLERQEKKFHNILNIANSGIEATEWGL